MFISLKEPWWRYHRLCPYLSSTSLWSSFTQKPHYPGVLSSTLQFLSLKFFPFDFMFTPGGLFVHFVSTLCKIFRWGQVSTHWACTMRTRWRQRWNLALYLSFGIKMGGVQRTPSLLGGPRRTMWWGLPLPKDMERRGTRRSQIPLLHFLMRMTVDMRYIVLKIYEKE